MKPRCLLLLLVLVLPACSQKDLRQAIDVLEASLDEAPLSEAEVAAGLKDALAKGIARGAEIASAQNGYLGNPSLKIPFPREARQVEKALRKIGLGKEVDRFVRQLNRAAEQAAAEAAPIFVDAIRSMTIRDAFEILKGDADAATQYLIRTTGDDLYRAFLPVVNQTLDQTRATRYYGDIVRQYNQLPGVKKVNPDLDAYATEKAIHGLFLLVAEEEANIRANPAARGTDLLRRVFGSLD